MTPDDDDPTIFIRCTRCEDFADPAVPSSKSTCCRCGRDVWVGDSTRAILAQRFPGKPHQMVCVKCGPVDSRPATNLPEHVKMLQEQGVDDSRIVVMLAIAEVAVDCTLEEAAEEIRDFPEGERARAMPAALRRAALLVASTYLPAN